jgi:hypothetical protein
LLKTLSRKGKRNPKQLQSAFYVPGQEDLNPLILGCSNLWNKKRLIKNGKEFYTAAKIVHKEWGQACIYAYAYLSSKWEPHRRQERDTAVIMRYLKKEEK